MTRVCHSTGRWLAMVVQENFESQNTLFKILHLNLNDIFLKCHPRLKGGIWISNDILRSVIWVSKEGYESQMTFWKVSFETQRRDLDFKWHFEKCHLSLKGGIWISDDILKSVIWVSKEASESQMTFWKVSFETQRRDMNLKWHFEKCHLRLLNVLRLPGTLPHIYIISRSFVIQTTPFKFLIVWPFVFILSL